MADLRRLEVGGYEHEGAQADRRRCRGGCTGEIARRRTGEGVEAERNCPGRRDRDDAVLERQSWVSGVVLEPQPLDAELATDPRALQERRRADIEATLGRCVDRQQLQVAPDPGRAGLDRGALDFRPNSRVVVRDFEGTETRSADV